ncbi:EML6 [Mytilus coruscus]|uniref:EML6 n=1 Tax=Mytilus coruscus TaxID=42192 RepID=A0A6J8CNC0_MYTCO|nr:EML6 [Mytilus coruscus]
MWSADYQSQSPCKHAEAVLESFIIFCVHRPRDNGTGVSSDIIRKSLLCADLPQFRGTLGNIAKLCDRLCIAYCRAAEICYSDGSDGNVFVWNGTTLQKTVKAHEGPLFAMHSLDKGFVTGGKDGVVGLWNYQFEQCLKTYSIKKVSVSPDSRGMLMADSPTVRAIVLGHGKILVGTKNGEILEIDKAGPLSILTQGHMEGEIMRGLACHPTQDLFATVSDDKTVSVWNTTEEHKMLSIKKLKQARRCITFSTDGKHLAVGLKDGKFAKHKKYVGHSAHVTNVRWTASDRKLIWTGGADTAVMVWNCSSPEDKHFVHGERYESDVKREKNMDYGKKIYVNTNKERDKIKPQLQETVAKPSVSRNVPEPQKVKRAEPPTSGSKRKKITQVTSCSGKWSRRLSNNKLMLLKMELFEKAKGKILDEVINLSQVTGKEWEDAFSKKIWDKNAPYIFENIYLPAAQAQNLGNVLRLDGIHFMTSSRESLKKTRSIKIMMKYLTS